MANSDAIQKHFKNLRVETSRRRRGRDPFATGFEDDSDDDTTANRKSTSASSPAVLPKSPPPVAKPLTQPAPGPVPPKNSALSATDKLVDSDDDWLIPSARTDRRPSPAPSHLARSSVSSGAGRRGSLDKGLQGPGGVQTNRTARSARAQAAGTLAYLDDSDEEEEWSRPARADRSSSPASLKKSEPTERRASTPKGSREAPSEQQPIVQSRHTVASPFAGTKYLEDSETDSDEEAVTSRSNSTDETAASSTSSTTAGPEKKDQVEVRREDKPNVQYGGGVSWRAFSASRTEKRNTELEALQANLRQRGKSISFGTHALTDDGKRVPLAPQQFAALAGGGSKRGRTRGKSPPRRTEDTSATEDEVADRGAVGVYDPKQYKTNPFTGQPVRRKDSDSERNAEVERSPSSAGSIPSIRVDYIAPG